ncbi:MAG TPA: transcription termination/antitermination protein NusA [Gammaproteobacteria bacterium]|nr:transcription termination/antitermination protein NusA [Gammaproteobacteria bacterium]
MNNKEILQVVEVVSNEKGLEADTIFLAIELALAAARKKIATDESEYRVVIDRSTGEYETFRVWQVVADEADAASEDGSSDPELVFNPDAMIRVAEARQKNPDIQPGDVVEELVEGVPFGRIASQQAKQVIVQKVREAERAKINALFEPRVGEMLTGQVKRVDRGNVIVDLGGGAEGIITRDKLIPRENVRGGDRVSALLTGISEENRGPQLLLSRTAPQLLIELFRREVPEVSEGVVEITGAARDPGVRAKIAVLSHEARIDPIGACVGMHGTRVQSVSNELGGERVDIVLDDDNAGQFVINALSPAKIVSITVDEESQSMDIAVEEDQLSLAIGRGGQNVRLASELTGWSLNMMSIDEVEQKQEAEVLEIAKKLVDLLDVGQDVAEVLALEGFTNLEEIAFVPVGELLDIEGFDEELVEELRQRAQDVLLTQEISLEENVDEAKPADDLMEVDGMTQRMALLLAAAGVVTREDLAEQAVDDLLPINEMTEELAGRLIMAARAVWFE